MSRRLYDLKCGTCGHIHERLLSEQDNDPKRCPACLRATATKSIIRPPRVGMLEMGAQKDASETAIDYFDKVHRQQMKIEERYEQEHGDYGPRPGAD